MQYTLQLYFLFICFYDKSMTIVCHAYLNKCDLNVSNYVQFVQLMTRYMSKHTRMMQKDDIRIGKIHAI